MIFAKTRLWVLNESRIRRPLKNNGLTFSASNALIMEDFFFNNGRLKRRMTRHEDKWRVVKNLIHTTSTKGKHKISIELKVSHSARVSGQNQSHTFFFVQYNSKLQRLLHSFFKAAPTYLHLLLPLQRNLNLIIHALLPLQFCLNFHTSQRSCRNTIQRKDHTTKG